VGLVEWVERLHRLVGMAKGAGSNSSYTLSLQPFDKLLRWNGSDELKVGWG
jgi:hypothetical protein